MNTHKTETESEGFVRVLCHVSESCVLTIQLPREIPWRQAACGRVHAFSHRLCLVPHLHGVRVSCSHLSCPSAAPFCAPSVSAVPRTWLPSHEQAEPFPLVATRKRVLFLALVLSPVGGMDGIPCASLPLGTFCLPRPAEPGLFLCWSFSHDQKVNFKSKEEQNITGLVHMGI